MENKMNKLLNKGYVFNMYENEMEIIDDIKYLVRLMEIKATNGEDIKNVIPLIKSTVEDLDIRVNGKKE
jgi:hypothetical protein